MLAEGTAPPSVLILEQFASFVPANTSITTTFSGQICGNISDALTTFRKLIEKRKVTSMSFGWTNQGVIFGELNWAEPRNLCWGLLEDELPDFDGIMSSSHNLPSFHSTTQERLEDPAHWLNACHDLTFEKYIMS